MIVRRAIVVLLASAAAFAAFVGCGSDPVGLDSCRKIEDARCEAAPACPDLDVNDVDACKRYYRDQCLHGLAIAEDPGGPAVAKCVAAIQGAGTCARSLAPTAACTSVATTVATTGCGLVLHPEIAVDCAFLVPPPPSTPPAVTQDAGDEGDTTTD